MKFYSLLSGRGRRASITFVEVAALFLGQLQIQSDPGLCCGQPATKISIHTVSSIWG